MMHVTQFIEIYFFFLPCSPMPRQKQKQQHFDLGEILGIGKSKKRMEKNRVVDGAPKVTAEKMGKFVEAMTDLVKVTLHTYVHASYI